MKTCTKCGESKPLTEYYVRKDAVTATHRAKCKVCYGSACRTYAVENPEKRREANRRWAANNPEKVKAKRARWIERHPDRYKLTYSRSNEAWRKANPDRVLMYQRQRRTLRGSITAEGKAYMEILLGDPCSYCGERADTIDHIVALKRGGTGAWENLTASCRSCNASKNATGMLLWMAGAERG